MEFTKEENIAIETLKEVASDDFDTLGDDISPKMAQNILNVIDNQQKEIEDLKETNEDNAEKSLLNDIFIKKNYISKNKIREKVKDYTEKSKHPLVNSQSRREYTFGLKALKELLEENDE